MKVEMDLDMLAGRLAAQDVLIAQLQAIVVNAGLISPADLAALMSDYAEGAKAIGNHHLASIMSARAASARQRIIPAS